MFRSGMLLFAFWSVALLLLLSSNHVHAASLRGLEMEDTVPADLPNHRDLFYVDTLETITDAIYDAIRRFFNMFKP
jgi:hypothetical protein